MRERATDGGSAEHGRGHASELAEKGTDGGALGTDDDDVGHGNSGDRVVWHRAGAWAGTARLWRCLLHCGKPPVVSVGRLPPRAFLPIRELRIELAAEAAPTK